YTIHHDVCSLLVVMLLFFFFSSRRRHTRLVSDWSSDVCSSDLFSGVSRTHSTSGRLSLRLTSAARSIKLRARPWAIPASVPMLHGRIIMAVAGYEPPAPLAPMSSFVFLWNFFVFAPTRFFTSTV